MAALIGKKKGEACLGGEFQEVDTYDLYKKLCDVWDCHDQSECINKEEKILANLRIDMPVDFEDDEHPLEDCTDPALYRSMLTTYLRTLERHIDHDGLYGHFDYGGYALKEEGDREGWVSIWPKEVYAAVHAARDGRDYKEYLTWSIHKFLEIGL